MPTRAPTATPGKNIYLTNQARATQTALEQATATVLEQATATALTATNEAAARAYQTATADVGARLVNAHAQVRPQLEQLRALAVPASVAIDLSGCVVRASQQLQAEPGQRRLVLLADLDAAPQPPVLPHGALQGAWTALVAACTSATVCQSRVADWTAHLVDAGASRVKPFDPSQDARDLFR